MIGELLDELRRIIDAREALAAQDRPLATRRAEIEKEILDHATASGLQQFATDDLSVTVDLHAMRCRYDPERWDELMKWAVGLERCDLIQRRLNDAKILDLIDNGMALPDGLSVETYGKVSARRK